MASESLAADRFRRYEENFLNSTRIVSRGVHKLGEANGNVDAVISSSVDIEGELSEAEGYLKAMDVEYRTMSMGDKRSVQQKVTDYKEEFRMMQQNFQTAKFQAESLALKGGPSSRTKLLTANQRLDHSTATLEQSRRLVGNTEKIGDSILADMEAQKETLMDAHNKVKETKGFTVEAKRVLRLMGNRAFTHKCCIMFLIFFLAGVIGVIAYFGFIQRNMR